MEIGCSWRAGKGIRGCPVPFYNTASSLIMQAAVSSCTVAAASTRDRDGDASVGRQTWRSSRQPPCPKTWLISCLSSPFPFMEDASGTLACYVPWAGCHHWNSYTTQPADKSVSVRNSSPSLLLCGWPLYHLRSICISSSQTQHISPQIRAIK